VVEAGVVTTLAWTGKVDILGIAVTVIERRYPALWLRSRSVGER
jgi:hypothetical protein